MTKEQFEVLKTLATAALQTGLVKSLEAAAQIMDAINAAKECVKQ